MQLSYLAWCSCRIWHDAAVVLGMMQLSYLVWCSCRTWHDAAVVLGMIQLSYLAWCSCRTWYDAAVVLGMMQMSYLAWCRCRTWHDAAVVLDMMQLSYLAWCSCRIYCLWFCLLVTSILWSLLKGIYVKSNFVWWLMYYTRIQPSHITIYIIQLHNISYTYKRFLQ